MKAKLTDREWCLLISLFILFAALVTIAYVSKDFTDPAVEKFFKEKKIKEGGNFDCTK